MAKGSLKPLFNARIVLGEGYPWAIGTGPYKQIQLNEAQKGVCPLPLDFPRSLWNESVPKYRLVLEKVGAKSQDTLLKEAVEVLQQSLASLQNGDEKEAASAIGTFLKKNDLEKEN